MQTWLVCKGCDEGEYSEGPAGWPCSTAEIVYTAAEITALEPQVPECPEHPKATVVTWAYADGRMEAGRWLCDHMPKVPVVSDLEFT